MAICTFERKAALIFIDRMLAALEAKPMTRAEMEVELFASKTKMLNYIRHLHGGETKRIYIKRWASTSGPNAPVYAVGDLPDAPKPRPLTDEERAKLEWKRIRANQDRYENAKAAARIRLAISKIRGKPQGIFAALGI